MKFHRNSLHFAKQQSCQIIHLELIRNEINGWCRNTSKNRKNPHWVLVSLCIWRLVRVNWSHTVRDNIAGVTRSSWPRLCSPLTCFQFLSRKTHPMMLGCAETMAVSEWKGFLGHHVQLQLLWQFQNISRSLISYISELGFLSSFTWGRRK